MNTLTKKSVAAINNVERLTHLSYQTAKRVIDLMEEPQAQKMFQELQEHINHMYTQMQGFASPTFVGSKKLADGSVDLIFKPAPVRPKDFNALMGGTKKLEILYGYFFDKLNGTEFSSVR